MLLAPLDDMWPNYPPTHDIHEVATLVGGQVGRRIETEGWETCCVRLSRSLNYSGREIKDFAKLPNPYMTRKKDGSWPPVRASSGVDRKWYIYSCYDLRVYLEHTFGKPTKVVGPFNAAAIADTQGIIMFEFRHVDLWNGATIRYNTDFTDGTKSVKEMTIWETPS